MKVIEPPLASMTVALVYIAGPFRAPSAWGIEQNIRRAEELALEVWKRGAAAICPHANTRFFQGAAEDKVFLEGDLEILRRCDAVLCTPDWEKSEGAKAEVEEAKRLEIPVYIYGPGFPPGLWKAIWDARSVNLCPNCGELRGAHRADCIDAPGN